MNEPTNEPTNEGMNEWMRPFNWKLWKTTFWWYVLLLLSLFSWIQKRGNSNKNIISLAAYLRTSNNCQHDLGLTGRGLQHTLVTVNLAIRTTNRLVDFFTHTWTNTSHPTPLGRLTLAIEVTRIWFTWIVWVRLLHCKQIESIMSLFYYWREKVESNI